MPFWAPYVPVAQRRARALREMERLRKKGRCVEPVEIDGRAIAHSFWGKGWCDHLESFADFANRLPRGRTYVRNGSVCHLAIAPGRIEAIVSGSSLYNVNITVRPLGAEVWKSVRKRCAGRIGSMLELLQGRLSGEIMQVVADRTSGLFPLPKEIRMQCSCPDWATMCKHVAAVLYGVGSRLDSRPDLLFVLRGVDAGELIATEIALPAARPAEAVLDESRLGDIFGIELDGDHGAAGDGGTAGRRAGALQEPGRSRGQAAAGGPVEAPRRPGRRVADAEPAGTAGKEADAGRTAPAAAPAPPRAAATGRPKTAWTGRSVARLRRSLGLSVTEFARRLAVSAACVRRWETIAGRLNLHARIRSALAGLQSSPPDGPVSPAKPGRCDGPDRRPAPAAPPGPRKAARPAKARQTARG